MYWLFVHISAPHHRKGVFAIRVVLMHICGVRNINHPNCPHTAHVHILHMHMYMCRVWTSTFTVFFLHCGYT